MRRLISLAVVLACGGAATAAPGPTTQPATRPNTVMAPATRPAAMTGERQPRRGTDGNRSRRSGESASNAASRPDSLDISSSGPMPQDFEVLNLRNIFYKGYLPAPGEEGRGASEYEIRHAPETMFIFNGVTITDGKPTAFLENTNEGTVVQVHVGDAVAKGKIVNIAIDNLDYEANGKVTRVQIAQNLAGGNGWGTTASTEPSTTGSSAADAMLEKLRQKRLQELNGK